MNSAAELVRQTAEHLVRQYDVGVDLDEVLRALNAKEPEDGAQEASTILDERVRALKNAAVDLNRLRSQIARLVADLPFTEAGWPARKAVLEEQIRSDFQAGLAAWLEDWATAAAAARLDAVWRLVGDVAMPPAAATTVERCAFATAGIERLEWALAAHPLASIAAGLHIDGNEVPSAEVRGRLWLLLARLALRDGRPEEAGEALDSATDLAPEASVEALRARCLRLSEGDPAAAEARIESARRADPANLDVAVELIERATLEEMGDEYVQEVARLAIGALSSTADSERELRPLLGAIPGAIWLAIMERALPERDFERCEWAAREAEGAVASESVLASIAQLRATAATERGAPADERVEALNAAGSHWLWAGRPQEAVPVLEEARSVEPADEQSSLLLADALTGSMQSEPLSEAAPEAMRALDLIARARKRHGVTEQGAWGYLVEADAHLLLAQGIGPARDSHLWRALEAVCRGTAYATGVSAYWAQMAEVTNVLSLPIACEAAAGRAVELDPGNAHAQTQLISALTNAGKLAEADELLAGDEQPWAQCVRAFMAVRKGEPDAALRLLRSLDPLPTDHWVIDILIDALILSGLADEAREEAAKLYERCQNRLDERDSRGMAANAAMVLGRFAEGEALLAELIDQPGYRNLLLLGRLQLLQGDEAAGLATLGQAFAHASRLGLDEWATVNEPSLRIFAGEAAVRLPAMDSVEKAIGERDEELRLVDDPLTELEKAPVDKADPELVEAGRSMSAALFLYVRGDREAMAATLAPALSRSPGDPELAMLEALSRETVLASAGDPPSPHPVDEEATEPPKLQLLLPPSWFVGHTNPVLTHPLFLRSMPEMRIRAGWEVPGVSVNVDEDLEPDRYRLWTDGEPVEEGRVSPDWLYLMESDIATHGLQVKPVSGSAGESALVGAVAVEPQEVGADGGLAELLAMTPDEVVARLVGAYAEKRVALLSGG